MEKGEFTKAEELARGSLKDCQNFIKDFLVGTKYHMQLEKAISDLNSVLSVITTKQEKTKEEAERKLKEAETIISSKTNISGSNIDSNSKYYKTKILSEEIRDTATKIAEAQMNFDEFPKTSYGFEKAYNSMKKRPDVFYNYLKFLTAKGLFNIYKNSELSYNLLIGIFITLKQFSLVNSESAIVGIEFLINIPKNKNFSLIKKFLKKSDKEDLKSFIESLKTDYQSEFEGLTKDLDLEKLYF
jgi:hypothetical protein